MTALSNPKHERFAQELAKGKTATEAYVVAGRHEHCQPVSLAARNLFKLSKQQTMVRSRLKPRTPAPFS